MTQEIRKIIYFWEEVRETLSRTVSDAEGALSLEKQSHLISLRMKEFIEKGSCGGRWFIEVMGEERELREGS